MGAVMSSSRRHYANRLCGNIVLKSNFFAKDTRVKNRLSPREAAHDIDTINGFNSCYFLSATSTTDAVRLHDCKSYKCSNK